MIVTYGLYSSVQLLICRSIHGYVPTGRQRLLITILYGPDTLLLLHLYSSLHVCRPGRGHFLVHHVPNVCMVAVRFGLFLSSCAIQFRSEYFYVTLVSSILLDQTNAAFLSLSLSLRQHSHRIVTLSCFSLSCLARSILEYFNIK